MKTKHLLPMLALLLAARLGAADAPITATFSMPASASRLLTLTLSQGGPIVITAPLHTITVSAKYDDYARTTTFSPGLVVVKLPPPPKDMSRTDGLTTFSGSPVVTRTADGWEITFAEPKSAGISITNTNSSVVAKPATPRAYTVAEVDELRATLLTREEEGTASPEAIHAKYEAIRKSQEDRWLRDNPGKKLPEMFTWSSYGNSYNATERTAKIEQYVSTAMTAGITAADIRAEDKREYDEAHKPAVPAPATSSVSAPATASTSRP